MVCTGRAPFSTGLGLPAVNIDVSKTRGFVQVNEKMQALDPEGNVAPAPQDPLDDAAYPDLIPEAAAAEAAEREALLHATRQAAALGLPPLGAWW